MSVRTVASKMIYENRWLSLREDDVEHQDGSRGLYSVVTKPDYSLVVPEERGGFHLVEQYRYPVRSRSWEFPSGSLPPGTTGSAEEAALVELAEETGFRANTLRRLGYLKCANSMTDEGVHIFHATELTAGEPRREATEQDMRQQWFSRQETESMVRTGGITDAPSVAAYLLWMLRR